MSLLLIVLLLDESHLGLVEDVLKEINFNNEDWKQLGRQLRVRHDKLRLLGRLYPKISLNLKECLRKWLSGDSLYDNLPPTLYELAAALKSIGYSEADEYIIKTYSRLIIMFNDQCY